LIKDDDIVQPFLKKYGAIVSTSGVGCQARYLIDGLLRTGKYQFRCLGAAIKHTNYDIVNVPAPNNEWNDGDWVIKPIDGFGDVNIIRYLLATEEPDAILLFTDPRFFPHIFELEDEIHQVCPIAWWHVWDNDPWPSYNEYVYESIDLCNCHSYKTFSMVKEHYPELTNFIPHAVPETVFHPLPKEQVKAAKVQILGESRKDDFIGFWVNRNARRKMPGDLLHAWSIFLKMLEEKHGHRKACLIMHTDPKDQEGPNLLKIVEHFNIFENVAFSTDRVDFAKMAMLHNIADFAINIACNEGFGLLTLEAMMCGKPVIALKTGGMTRQIVDHRDGSENGIALEPEVRNLVGSQVVPFIFEDHISNETVAKSIMEMHDWGEEKRKQVGQKALEYAHSEFNMKKTVSDWDTTLMDTILNWKDKRKSWKCIKM